MNTVITAREGLELLLEIIQRDTAIKHNQDVWGRHSKKHPPDEANYCGTQACLAGKLALSPEGKELGIEYTWKKTYKGFFLEINGSQDISSIARYISGKIGVYEDDLYDLFRSYAGGKREVVRRIKHLLETRSHV